MLLGTILNSLRSQWIATRTLLLPELKPVKRFILMITYHLSLKSFLTQAALAISPRLNLANLRSSLKHLERVILH